ncbi:MAG: hypothetical protein ACI898_001210, partial [Flavobacteriales bacterium]
GTKVQILFSAKVRNTKYACGFTYQNFEEGSQDSS